MFRCTDCKRIYKEKVDYCDCGNNVFDEIVPPPQPVQQPQPQVQQTVETPVAQSVLPLNAMSIIVFSLCCVFSLCFVLFLGPAPKKRAQAPKKVEKTVTKEIPDIEKIWDSTPAYTLQPAVGADLGLYKDSLRNALLSHLNTEGIAGLGSCEVEFVLDEHGNLKKKKLYKNTANKPLIEATKKMLSGMKLHNAPPKTYDGEPLNLEVYATEEGRYTLRYKN